MDIALQIAVGLVATMMLGLGTASMFAPTKMLDNFAIDPRGVAGLNTIRGVIGGLFLGSVAMLGTGLVTGQTLWFVAVAAILGAVAMGRVVGAVLDGPEKAVFPPLVVEVVMVTILIGAHVVLGSPVG